MALVKHSATSAEPAVDMLQPPRVVKVPAKPLARLGDPYVTAYGDIIQPERVVNDDSVEAQSIAPENFKAGKQRSLKELPAPVNIINGVAAVFLYSALGVSDREIAQALKVKVDDVRQIRAHTAYAECFDIISQEFISANSDLITARIAAYSHQALSSVAQVAFNGKKEETRYRASADLLDRAGHTPKESVNRASMTRNELRIVVVKANEDVNIKISGDDDG